MTLGPIQFRDKVLRNIAAQGEVGASWLEALPSLLHRLEVEWGIKVGRPFPNATEAFVSEAVTALFSSKVRRLIISSVIVGSSVRLKEFQPNPTGDAR